MDAFTGPTQAQEGDVVPGGSFVTGRVSEGALSLNHGTCRVQLQMRQGKTIFRDCAGELSGAFCLFYSFIYATFSNNCAIICDEQTSEQ